MGRGVVKRVGRGVIAALAAVLVGAGFVFVAPAAHAANPDIVVTTSVDVVDPVDGVLSLREAVSLANATAGANTIILTAGTTYALTICDGSPDAEQDNAVGALDPQNAAGLTILGNGSTVVQGCPIADADRVITTSAGRLELDRVTLTGGHGLCTGALLSVGDLSLASVTVTDNEALPCAGAMSAVEVQGVASVFHSLVTDNAGTGLRLLGAGSNVTGTTVSGNGAGGLVGGIFLADHSSLVASTVSGNAGTEVGGVSFADSGIVWNTVIAHNTATVTAGGLHGGHLDVMFSSITDNGGTQTPGADKPLAGGIDAEDLRLDTSIVASNAAGGVGGVNVSHHVDLLHVSIDGNGLGDPGMAPVIGGLRGASGTIAESTISNNRGQLVGGHYGLLGFLEGPDDLSLDRVTVTGNQAVGDPLHPSVPTTGGLRVDVMEHGGTASVRGSVVVGNAATGSITAGANVAEFVAWSSPEADVVLARTALGAGAAGIDCDVAHVNLVSEGDNFAGDDTCGLDAPSDTSDGGDPMLGPLGPHGGPVGSMLPLPQSPLIDRVPTGSSSCPGRDVDGVATPLGPACDIGPAEAPVPTTRYHAVTPERVLDSRTGLGFSGSLGQAPRELVVGGKAGVPASATALVMNVTATNGTAGSYLTVWGARRPPPAVASLNYGAGETRNGLVTVRSGPGASIDLRTAVGTTDVVADVVGWYGPDVGDGFTATGPTRILDSRTGEGFSGAVGQTPRDLTVTNVGGVPGDATAVALNVTVTQSTAASFLTVWPAGQPRPLASSSNFAAGETLDLAVVAKVGAGGKVSFHSGNGSTQVVADVVGYYTATGGAAFHPVPPTRIADSRSNTGITGPVGNAAADLQTAANTTLMGQSPGPATGVVANVAVTQGSTASVLTAWPSGAPKPLAANLVYGPGQTLNNLGFLAPGTGGTTSFATGAGTVQVIADAAGWFG